MKRVLVSTIGAAFVCCALFLALNKAFRPLRDTVMSAAAGAGERFSARSTHSENDFLALPAGWKIHSAPLLRDRGNVVVLIAENENGARQLFRSRRGESPSALLDATLTLAALPAVSEPGTRVTALVRRTGEERQHIVLWELGLGADRIGKQTFIGSWLVSISADGRVALLYPEDRAAAYSESDSGPLITGRALEILFQERMDSRTLSAAPAGEIRPSPIVHSLSLSVPARAVSADGRTIATDETARAGVNLERLPSRRAANDGNLDGFSGADLLTFRAAGSLPLWEGRTLVFEHSFERLISGASGTSLVWRVGAGRAVPITGDFDGDGVMDLVNYDPRSSTREQWQIFLSGPVSDRGKRFTAEPQHGGFQRVIAVAWGGPGMVAVPGDFDGDERTDISVYSRAEAAFYLLLSGGGFNVAKGLLGSPGFGIRCQIGPLGGTPVAGDFDGDGRSDLAVWSIEGGRIVWRIISSAAPCEAANIETVRFGREGDVPQLADFDGDGRTDLAVFQPDVGRWVMRAGSGGDGERLILSWSVPNALPWSADFDGDGRSDFAFFVPANEERWQIRFNRVDGNLPRIFSANAETLSLKWGSPDALPVSVLLRRHQLEDEKGV